MTHAPATPITATAALAALWHDAGLPPDLLPDARCPGQEPMLRSSFRVTSALQASLAAAALAAVQWGQLRGGPRQQVAVPPDDVVRESSAWFRIDGQVPPMWDAVSGLYRCGAGGWVRIHANFAHHRDGALALLGLAPGATRADVAQALQRWEAAAFERAAADAGLVVAAARRFDEWDAHPHAAVVAAQPLVGLRQVGAAQAPAPLPWAGDGDRPLRGLRVLDLTRILAGPVGARTLAAHGADVLMVNGPHLPNIDAIADVSRGKRSAHVDLRTDAGRAQLRALVREADVFIQGYRPGALAALGFGSDDLHRLNPALVAVSLSAYGADGPWGGRRGFDSLVQTATGFNHAEAHALGSEEPKALPLQVLDYSTGFLVAFGALAALLRRQQQGGGWTVDLTLARTGLWLRGLGRCSGHADVSAPTPDLHVESTDSGFGRLDAQPHAAWLSHTPPRYERASMPPGSHAPEWLPRV